MIINSRLLKIGLLLFLFIFPFVNKVEATSYTLDPNFWAVDYDVYSIVEDATDIYIGGDFDAVGLISGSGAKVNVDTLDRDTNLPITNGTIYSVIADSLGGWYIGGSFTKVGDTLINKIAHILSSGVVDLEFNPNANGTVRVMISSGDYLYIGGEFSSIGGQTRNRLAKINKINGVADITFNPNSNSTVYSLGINGNDLYVGGAFATIGGQSRNRIAKLNTSTGLADLLFDPNSNGDVLAILVTDTELYVGGSFTSIGGQTRNRIARLDLLIGSSDLTFDPNAASTVRALALNGTDLYIGGDFNTVGGLTHPYLAKIDTTTGSVDADLNLNIGAYVYSIVLSEEYIYVGTSSDYDLDYFIGPNTGTGVEIDKETGTRNTSMPIVNGNILTTISDGAGGWYLGGAFTQVGASSRNYLAHVLSDGSVDPTFNPAPNSWVYSLALSGGTLYTGGNFTSIGGQTRNRIAKMDATTGVVDLTFNPGAGSTVYTIQITGNDLYAGGFFTTIGGQARRYLAKLDATTGVVDLNFNVYPNTSVLDIKLDSDNLYFGGRFDYFGPIRGYGAEIDTDTNVLNSSLPVINGTIRTVVSDGIGGWFIGGDFTTVGGLTRNKIAHILSDNTVDAGFDPNANANVYTLLLSGSDLYVGGNFTSIAGTAINRLAKLNATTGVIDAGFNANANSYVVTLSLYGGYLYTGGYFTSIGGQSRTYLARLNPATGVADAGLNIILNSYVNSIVTADNYLYVGGQFSNIVIDGKSFSYFFRADTTTGSIDSDFHFYIAQHVYSLLVSGDELFVGGLFTYLPYQFVNHEHLFKIDLTTLSIDETFRPDPDGTVWCMNLIGDDLYVGGEFLSIGGDYRSKFAKIDKDTGDVDQNFNINADGIVRSIFSLGDKLFVGGYFTSIGGNNSKMIGKISRFDGSPDPTFRATADDDVEDILISGDDIYIAGYFFEVNNTPRKGLALLDKYTGELDPNFRIFPNYLCVTTMLKLDNELLIGGDFTRLGNIPRNYFGKVDAITGEVDQEFENNTGSYVFSLSIQDDDIYVGGSFNSFGGYVRNGIARISIDTNEIDPAFKVEVPDDVFNLALNGDYLYFGGQFSFTNSVVRTGVAKLNTETMQIDENFNPDLDWGELYALHVSGDYIFIGGSFETVNGVKREFLAKLDKNTGAVVEPFNATPSSDIEDIAVDDNYVYIGGYWGDIGGYNMPQFARLDAVTGALDVDFNLDVDGYVTVVKPYEDSLFLGGNFDSIAGEVRHGLAKVSTETGAIDPEFNSEFVFNEIDSLLFSGDDLYAGGSFIQSDAEYSGRGVEIDIDDNEVNPLMPEVNNIIYTTMTDNSGGWYIGGDFTDIGGVTRNKIAHILSDGSVDPVFNPNASGSVYSILAYNGSLYVGGDFVTIGGQAMNKIAKLDPVTGVVDLAFDPNASSRVQTIATDGTHLFIGGYFTTIGGTTRNRIAKVDIATGALDATFNPNASHLVDALIYHNGSIYVGGSFTTISGVSRNYLAKLDATSGAADPSFIPNPSSTIYSLFYYNDALYVGGYFTTISGQSFNNLAKLNPTNAQPDSSFKPNPNGAVLILNAYDNSLYVGGAFSAISGEIRNSFAKISLDDATLDPLINVSFDSTVYAIDNYSDKVYVGGSFTMVGGDVYRNLIKLNVDTGQIDTGFNPGPNNWVNAIQQINSDIYVGGSFTSVGTVRQAYIVKVDSIDGSIDTDFDPLFNSNIGGLMVSSSDLYLGGSFSTVDQQDYSYLAKMSIDTSAPILLNISPIKSSVINNINQTITFNTDENATCRLSLVDESYDAMADNVSCGGTDTTSHSCITPDLGADGTKNLYVACVDEGNNKDSIATNEDLTYTLDTTPPVISYIYPIPGITIYDRTPRITFRTDENAYCRLSLYDESYADMANNVSCEEDGTLGHLCRSSYLGADGEKNIYLSCMDSVGNAHDSSNNTGIDYTLSTMVEEADIIKDVTVIHNEDGTVTISWRTDIDTITTIKYAVAPDDPETVVYTNILTVDDEARSGTRSVTLSELEGGLEYLFVITAVDASGGISQYGGGFMTEEQGEFITYIGYDHDEQINSLTIDFIILREAECTITYGSSEGIYLNEGIIEREELNVRGIINTSEVGSDIYYNLECIEDTKIYNYEGMVPFSRGPIIDDAENGTLYKMMKGLSGFILSSDGERVLYTLAILPLLGLSISGLFYLPQLLNFGFFMLQRKEKGRNLGIIYDKESLKPVPFAVLRVFNNEGLVYESVSDLEGRYASGPLETGEYDYEIEHSDYKKFKDKIKVKEETNKDFALERISGGRGIRMGKVMGKILNILVLVGFIYSLLCVMFNPQLINIVIVICYIVQYIVRIIIGRMGKDGGRIEGIDGEGIGGVFVRIYDTQGKQLDTIMSGDKGRYRFNIPDGKYMIGVYRDGYEIDKGMSVRESVTGLKLIESEVKGGVVREVIRLRKL